MDVSFNPVDEVFPRFSLGESTRGKLNIPMMRMTKSYCELPPPPRRTLRRKGKSGQMNEFTLNDWIAAKVEETKTEKPKKNHKNKKHKKTMNKETSSLPDSEVSWIVTNILDPILDAVHHRNIAMFHPFPLNNKEEEVVTESVDSSVENGSHNTPDDEDVDEKEEDDKMKNVQPVDVVQETSADEEEATSVSFLQLDGTTPLSAEDHALFATIPCHPQLPLPGENGVWLTPQPPPPSSPIGFDGGKDKIEEKDSRFGMLVDAVLRSNFAGGRWLSYFFLQR